MNHADTDLVSVYYPRGVMTGGPEALHQLVDALRSFGKDAALVPFSGTQSADRSPALGMYDAPERRRTRRDASDLVVVPEVYLRGLQRNRPGQFLWWLSVDNCPLYAAQRSRANRDSLTPQGRVRLSARLVKGAALRLVKESSLREVEHLAQSHYAFAYACSRVGVEPSLLTDYTRSPVVDQQSRSKGGVPTVAFNPGKGGEYIKPVSDHVGGRIQWLPIERMSPAQVRTALERADVFLDLGAQPGKDRLPREAAAAGAISIVLRRGAGCFETDVALPRRHTVDARGDLVRNAVEVLDDVLSDLPLHYALQAPYRRLIAQEKELFFRQVETIFVSGGASAESVEVADR